MLNSKLILDINNDKEYNSIKSIIDDVNPKLKTGDVINNSEWIDNTSLKDLKEIICRLTQSGSLSTIEVEGYEDVIFDNNDIEKKLFLVNLSKDWESSIGINLAFSTMVTIDDMETEFGESALKFNKKQIEKSIIDLFDKIRYHRLRSQINIITRMQKFYSEQLGESESWNYYRKTKNLKGVLGDKAKEHLLTHVDLVNLSNIMPNAQDSIIPLLIFEGVSFSKVDDMDEVRYLRHGDLEGNTLLIRGNGSNKEREIDVDSDTADLIREASMQEYMERANELVELKDTDFVLRPVENSRKKSPDIDEHPDIISFRGAYSRVAVCKKYIEELVYDMPFSPKTIETAGKIYYVNKYINQGYDKNEAIHKTLKRFGNWYPHEDGHIGARNEQQVNRLSRVWGVYS